MSLVASFSRVPLVIFVTSRADGELVASEYLEMPGASADEVVRRAHAEFADATQWDWVPRNSRGEYSTQGHEYWHVTEDGQHWPAVLEVFAAATSASSQG